jgi:hypothetical protein
VHIILALRLILEGNWFSSDDAMRVHTTYDYPNSNRNRHQGVSSPLLRYIGANCSFQNISSAQVSALRRGQRGNAPAADLDQSTCFSHAAVAMQLMDTLICDHVTPWTTSYDSKKPLPDRLSIVARSKIPSLFMPNYKARTTVPFMKQRASGR